MTTKYRAVKGTRDILPGETGRWQRVERLFQNVALANRPILFLAVLLVIVGIQFVTMGLLAELQTRIYHESKKRPTYMVREKLGL